MGFRLGGIMAVIHTILAAARILIRLLMSGVFLVERVNIQQFNCFANTLYLRLICS